MNSCFFRKRLPERFRIPALMLVASALPITGFSQANAPASAGSDEEEEDLIELSPFVVSETEAVGYAATSTLAGTRIKTELKDLGSAVSVVTTEFLEDTGSRVIQDVLPYTVSSEVGGPQGNFSGSSVGSGAVFNTDNERADPRRSVRLRGIGQPNWTRSYLPTEIPLDSYNTSAITMNRGANSILFGLGSAAGVIDQGLMSPIIGRNAGRVDFQFGSFGSYRGSFNVSQTVVPDRVAVMLAGVYDQTEYQQDPAFIKNQRAYVAFDSVLLENKKVSWLGKTILRGNFEVGKSESNPPSSFAPIIAYKSFFEPPPDYRPYTGVDFNQGYDNMTQNFRKWATIDARAKPDPDNPGMFLQTYWEPTTSVHSTPFIFNTVGVAFDGITGQVQDRDGLNGVQGWLPTVPSTMRAPGSNAFRWNYHVNTRAYEETNAASGLFRAPTLTDTNVFDYRNNLITGDLSEVTTDFDNVIITLEQQFLDGNAGIELTYSDENFARDTYLAFGGGGRAVPVYIDTTEYLSDGAPNPNVGRAFLWNYYNFDKDTEEQWDRENARLTAFYKFDFNDVNDTLGKILGRHTFTGIVHDDDKVYQRLDYGKFWEGVGWSWGGTYGGNNTGWGAQVANIHYISDDLRGVEESDVRLHQLKSPRLQHGQTFNVVYFDRNEPGNDWPTLENGRLKRDDVQVLRFRRGGTIARDNVKSRAFTWQSHWLDGHIVGMVGLRHDEIDNYTRVPRNQLPGGTDRHANGQFKLEALQLEDEPSTTSGDTATYSLVGHLPSQWLENVPIISSVSAHWADSENFSAIAQRNDLYNNPIGNPQGTTQELGFSLGFADNRWYLKVNRFETLQKNVRIPNFNGAASGVDWLKNFANRWQTGANDPVLFPWEAQTDAIAAGFTGYDDIISKINTLLPEPAASIYDLQFNPDSEAWEYNDSIDNLTSVQDFKSTGWELELVGNPSPNWRVAANVTQIEATPSNSAPDVQRFADEVIAKMKSLNLYDTVREGVESIVIMSNRFKTQTVQPYASVKAKDGTATQELREWRVNVISTYDFREGMFKGFSVGGAVRWQSSVAIGYEYFLNPDGVPIPDVNKAISGPSEFNGDLWLGYRRQLTDKIGWKVQLNLRNILGSSDDIPVFAGADGITSVYRIAPSRTWFLTNTLTF